jgi:hypothetical protein
MAITFNRVSLPTSQVAAGTNTFSVTTSTGNLLLIAIVSDAYNVPISGITDNKGNIWTLILPSGTLPHVFGSNCAFAYCCGATVGVSSIAISSTISGGITIGFYDFSSTTGGALDIFDKYGSSFGSNPSPAILAGASGVGVFVTESSVAISAVASPFTLETLDITHLSEDASSAYYVDPSGGLLQAFYTMASGSFNAIGISLIEQPVAATPTFSPGQGYYGSSQTVSIYCTTPGSTITYTIDGSTPVPGSHGFTYTGPITVATSETVQAIATAPGYTTSLVGSATFIISSSILTNVTPNLEIALLVSGQNQPEITVNAALIALDEAMNSNMDFIITNAGVTLTLAQFASNFLLVFLGTLTGPATVTVPAISRFFAVQNLTTGGYPLTVIGTQVGSPLFPGVSVAVSSEPTLLYSTGTNGDILSFTTSGGGGGGPLPTPTTVSLTSSVPAGGGNFQVAHGLGVIPVASIIQMTSGGNIYYQSTRYDSTYLYLVATGGSVTGDALVWA